ncbi:MAG: HEAT repeat domain-containing protein [Planctomycetes bacterium]|nr:HEAT repeat domain-containing protein [Planctomycetota bacterium]
MSRARGRRAAIVAFAVLLAALAGSWPLIRPLAEERWLLARLGSQDPAVVRSAAESLVLRRSERAVPRISKLLRGELHPDLRPRGILGFLGGGPAVLDAVLGLRSREAQELQENALSELLGSGEPDPRYSPVLLRWLGDERHGQRVASTFLAMGKLAVPTLLDGAASPRLEVRRWALGALCGLAPCGPEALDLFTRAVADPLDELRAEAAAAVGRYEGAAAQSVQALIGALEDLDLRVRAAAAAALAAISPEAREAVPVLVRGIDQAQGAFTTVLIRLDPGGQRTVQALIEILRSGDAPAREESIHVLSAMYWDETFPRGRILLVLLGALKDAEPRVCRSSSRP